jgi:hypothetical protein
MSYVPSRRRAQERPGQINRHYSVPILVGCFEKWSEHCDASVVDQRIKPSESLIRSRYRLINGGGIGDVALQR